MSSFKILWVILIISTHQALFANGMYYGKKLVPALYAFGDSSIDPGNNNNLNTPAKANAYPYGIDFNNCSTGRYSNGKTFADLIAISLGLPMPPPYLSLSETERYQLATGINYASGSCGILNSTKSGECLSLDKQIEYFTSSVKNDLPKIINSKTEFSNYLSKSIYLISIGPNDYMLNYLKPMGPINKLSPEEFANYLLEQFASRIKRIYDLGARKFVINNIGPIGCIPANAIRTQHSQNCNEDINLKIKPYSDKLPGKLKHLQTQLQGSLFIYLDSFNYFMEIRNSPEKFVLSNIRDSCIEGGKVCKNRKEYYFFDAVHNTEASTKIFADECFSGLKLCFPHNIKKLVQAH